MALAMETSKIGDAFHGFMAVFTTWPIEHDEASCVFYFY